MSKDELTLVEQTHNATQRGLTMRGSSLFIASGASALVMLASLANSQDNVTGASPAELGEFSVYPAGEE